MSHLSPQERKDWVARKQAQYSFLVVTQHNLLGMPVLNPAQLDSGDPDIGHFVYMPFPEQQKDVWGFESQSSLDAFKKNYSDYILDTTLIEFLDQF